MATKNPHPSPPEALAERESVKAHPDQPVASTIDWDTLAEPITMASKASVGDIKVDVLTSVPEMIRRRAEVSLAKNAERVKASAGKTSKRNRVDYHYAVQPIDSEEHGKKFTALLVKYAKYRPSDKPVPFADADAPKGQVTARCGATSHYRYDIDGKIVVCAAGDADAFLGVRYSVRPFEARNNSKRLPGTV